MIISKIFARYIVHVSVRPSLDILHSQPVSAEPASLDSRFPTSLTAGSTERAILQFPSPTSQPGLRNLSISMPGHNLTQLIPYQNHLPFSIVPLLFLYNIFNHCNED